MRQVEDAQEQLTLFDLGLNLAAIREEANMYRVHTRAPATHKAYECDWRRFELWCIAAGRCSLPTTTETLELFVASRLKEGRKTTTVERGIAAIAFYHGNAGHRMPDREPVWSILAGARRKRKEQPNQRIPLLPEEARKICRKLMKDGGAKARRDRALITLGLATGLRSHNLAMLDRADIRFAPKGIAVTIRESKTDQEGKGTIVAAFYGTYEETCPVRAMQDWLEVRNKIPGAQVTKGLLFVRTSPGHKPGKMIPIWRNSVNLAVKEHVKGIGLDPSRYGAHSLRASFVTISHLGGAAMSAIMETTGHHSIEMMRRYIRNADPFAHGNLLAHAL